MLVEMNHKRLAEKLGLPMKNKIKEVSLRSLFPLES